MEEFVDDVSEVDDEANENQSKKAKDNKKKRNSKQNKKQARPRKLQLGTGKHFDINPHSLWKKQLKQHPKLPEHWAPLDRWRAFQSQVVLVNQVENDSSLEVLPGIHRLADRYYKLGIPSEGLNVFRRGSYSCHLFKNRNKDILDNFVYVRRIPENWDSSSLPNFPTKQEIDKMSRTQIASFIQKLQKELEASKGELPKEGDFIIWDTRTAHTTGVRNDSNQIRQTFYHAYLLANKEVNEACVNDLKERRKTGLHPADFPKGWEKLEMGKDYKPVELTDLGKKLYNEASWEENDEEQSKEQELKTNEKKRKVTESTKPAKKPKLGKEEKNISNDNQFEATYNIESKYIEFFKRYGFVVIPNVIEGELTKSLKEEIKTFLLGQGINMDKPETITIENYRKVSGTFGAMLELYWRPSMEKIRQHSNPYWVTVQLLQETWASGDKEGFEHPFGAFDPKKLWLYVDRCNMRLPSKIADSIPA